MQRGAKRTAPSVKAPARARVTAKVVPIPAVQETDLSVAIPLTPWRLSLPVVPDTLTVPLVHWKVTGLERESAAYYLVLGGLVAIEVIEWPVGLLLVTGHHLAKNHRYRGVEGVIEALEGGE